MYVELLTKNSIFVFAVAAAAAAAAAAAFNVLVGIVFKSVQQKIIKKNTNKIKFLTTFKGKKSEYCI